MRTAIPGGGDGILTRRVRTGYGVTHGPVVDLTGSVGAVIRTQGAALTRGVDRVGAGRRGTGWGVAEMVTVRRMGEDSRNCGLQDILKKNLYACITKQLFYIKSFCKFKNYINN